MPANGISPATNPGFLDTLTWDEHRAGALALAAVRDGRFSPLARAVADGYPESARVLDRMILAASKPPLSLVPGSAVAHPRMGLFLLGILADGQRVLVSISAGWTKALAAFGNAICIGESAVDGRPVTVHVFPLDLDRLRVFLAEIAPAYAPTVPARPGLGIGCRMGILDIPVALAAVRKFHLCASVIQSSVYRELAPLSDLTKQPLPQIDLPGVGVVPLGHTGMSITGQFVAMTVDRLERGDPTPIVADADHLPLRSATGAGQALAHRLIREAADRSLFTLDPHFCFYGGQPGLFQAMADGRLAEIDAAFRAQFSPGERGELLQRYAGRRFRVSDPAGGKGHAITMSAAELADCAIRFREPLAAIEDACAEIRRVKGRAPFAIEVSVDEVPGMSLPHHFYYLAAELARRRVPCFSLAPGLGFSKLDVDVRDPEGAFAQRVRILAGIARHFGAVMGIHSGDGKSVRTRRVLAHATGGSFWYKISPDRQRNFFRSLGMSAERSVGRQLFQEAYRSTVGRVLMLAANPDNGNETARVARQTLDRLVGSPGLSGTISRKLVRLLQTPDAPAAHWEALAKQVGSASASQVPGDPDDHIVHDYLFATVSEREGGGFRFRGRYYGLPETALRLYRRLDAQYLTRLVRSLGIEG
jgi:hypothetical protein